MSAIFCFSVLIFLRPKPVIRVFSDLRDGDLVYIKSNVQELLQFR